MIFLVQFGINKHLWIFQRPQNGLALRARALLLVFEKLTRAYFFQIALEIMWLPILNAMLRADFRPFRSNWNVTLHSPSGNLPQVHSSCAVELRSVRFNLDKAPNKVSASPDWLQSCNLWNTCEMSETHLGSQVSTGRIDRVVGQRWETGDFADCVSLLQEFVRLCATLKDWINCR